MTTDRVEQILDFAEGEIRRSGFDAVSFRDIAAAVGIKSASVHYHFPTKADLTRAVTARYAEGFIESLGSPSDPADSPGLRIARLSDAYLGAYRDGAATCLCAVLGAVAAHLPVETAGEVRSFYARLKAWIATAQDGQTSALSPDLVISILQGAMILAIASQDEGPLIEARAHLCQAIGV